MHGLGGIVALIGMAGLLAAAPAGREDQEHRKNQGDAMPAAKVEIRSADGRVTIPFRLVNNHVLIPITIGEARLEVILDTGMPVDGLMLYRTAKVEALALDYIEGMKVGLAGAGGDGGQVAAEMARDLTVDIGDLRLTKARAIVAPPIHSFVGYHDGVIGAALFGNFVVAIDFDANRITLHDPKTWAPPAGSVAVPLSLEHNFPFAEVAVLLTDGRRVPAKVVVDLGASHTISLNLGAVEGLEAPARTVRGILGLGLGGMVRGRVGRIAGLDLGGAVLRDVVATFPDEEHQRPGGMSSRGGNLGSGLLQRFNVAFDYANRRMTLVPNEGFAAPFEWDMSGLWLQPGEDGGLRIASIVEDSPAAKAGLAVGDIVTRVNGRDVAAGDLFAIREQGKRAGGVLEIVATRDGAPIEVTLWLKRLV